MTLWAATVILIGMRRAKMWEWKPRLYKAPPILTTVGVIITLFGSAAVPVWSSIAHKIIFRLDRATRALPNWPLATS